MSFTHCTKILSEAAGRALIGIIHKFKTIKDIGFRTYEKLYTTGVCSINEYASEIWGFKDYDVCNNIQNRAIRYYLGLHRFAPVGGLQGEFGWVTPKYRRFKNIICYWNRLIKMGNERLTKHLFNYDYQNNYCNWTSEVREIFVQVGLEELFNNKVCCNLKDLSELLHSKAESEWREHIQTKPKLRTYIIFKQNLEPETYVKFHMNKQQGSLLAQLRTGILPLKIETGRYNNIPVHERTCSLCNMNVTEDEIHFVMICPLYNKSHPE